jgi:D-alanyl-D-alanine endopeptidase (penicillin-binding protein 7)
MNILIPLQLLVFFFVPLMMPREVAAPAEAAEVMEAQEFHAILRRPPGNLATLPGLPPALDRKLPARKDPTDLGVQVGAKSAIVVDRRSGAILFSKDADRVHTIASLTKLMTAQVAIAIDQDLTKKYVIKESDHRGGSIEYFLTGETVTVKDLLYSSLVGSSNTATAALASSTGLTPEEFVAEMNAKAKDLQMTEAVFADPTGLDEGNHGTAKDVAILAQAAFGDPTIAKAATTAEYSFSPQGSKAKRERTVKSTDLLLGSQLNKGEYKIAGAKTGTLGVDTGYHLAIAIGNGDGHDVLVIVLGSETADARFVDAKSLAYWAFDAYEW